MSARTFVFFLMLGCAIAAGADSQLRPVLFYDPDVPQLAFAASEIAHSAGRALAAFPLERLSSASCSPCIVLSAGASQSASLARQLCVPPLAPAVSSPMAFAGCRAPGGTPQSCWPLTLSGPCTAQYTQPHLYNRVGFVEIQALTAKALEDVEIARQWKPGTIVDEKLKRPSADQPFRK